MEDWQKEFQIVCEEMKSNGETERHLPDRGEIIWRPDLECPNCHSKGTFYGGDLEYGAFYECASTRYCPACQKIYDVSEGRNFAIYHQKRFLPIMKKKLIAEIQTSRCIFLPKNKEGNCPVCGGDTYTFHTDLGAIDYYDNYWTVCVNPACNWPGRHKEILEWGPYYG